MAKADEALPCSHAFSDDGLDAVKMMLRDLDRLAPDLVAESGIPAAEWPHYLRAAIESLRGTTAATTGSKYRFVHEVLKEATAGGYVRSWEPIGSKGRSDFKVELSDGTLVCIEAKGCPDGNNTNIWDRPGWADEFYVWCQCPESLVHSPGYNAWAGVANRLLPKLAAERTIIDGFIYWDGRCGSRLRPCPKEYGITGQLRSAATDIRAQDGRSGWLPPPCVYLFPRGAPRVDNNPEPVLHNLTTVRFVPALLSLFGVPSEIQSEYVHDALIAIRYQSSVSEIKVGVRSRCWPDGRDRELQSRWKPLKRE